MTVILVDSNVILDVLTIESRERFEEVFGKAKSLKRLIREIVGCDVY
ncbi:hypothetical protein PN498_19855 [Oscillatoria sp. CS-180]|nr:hypothetical protein [Oscillatoria sp. CS-180]MDB9528257.1 hypothetical protein [Oscillatoria sp. CS-180]